MEIKSTLDIYNDVEKFLINNPYVTRKKNELPKEVMEKYVRVDDIVHKIDFIFDCLKELREEQRVVYLCMQLRSIKKELSQSSPERLNGNVVKTNSSRDNPESNALEIKKASQDLIFSLCNNPKCINPDCVAMRKGIIEYNNIYLCPKCNKLTNTEDFYVYPNWLRVCYNCGGRK